MTFFSFIKSLPFDRFVSSALLYLLTLFLAFGIYKFVKDWLPW